LWEAIDAYDAGLAAASPAELAGRGSAGYYLRQAALEAVIAQWMAAQAAASIHYGLLAGATPVQIADAMAISSAEVAGRWRSWADGQRHLELWCPGLGMSEGDYRRVAAVLGAAGGDGTGGPADCPCMGVKEQ